MLQSEFAGNDAEELQRCSDTAKALQAEADRLKSRKPSAVTKTELASSGPTGGQAATDVEQAADDHLLLLPPTPAAPADKPIPLPAGVKETIFSSHQERAKQWMRYERSLLSGASKHSIARESARASRTETASETVLSQIAGIHEKNYPAVSSSYI